MSSQTPHADEDVTDTVPDELSLLKDRARTLGIVLRGNVGVDSLRKQIADKLAEPAVKSERAKPLTKAQQEQEMRTSIQRKGTALVRCRIYNLNPNKKEWRGEFITVANRYLGTVRKFIPFGEATDGGYHIPRCIYNELVSRKFQQIRVDTKRGRDHVSTRLVPEYSVEVLPPLTKRELEELALKQAAAERMGAE